MKAQYHRQYHQRREVETTIDEVKTHLLGHKVPIHSLKPREVVQEIYGLLLGHWVRRSLMVQAAQIEGISPLQLSFTATLHVLRRAVAKFQGQSFLPRSITISLIREVLGLARFSGLDSVSLSFHTQVGPK